MHGHLGGGWGGHHHWGGGRHFGGGWGGGGLGWIFPAIVLGQLVSQSLDRQFNSPWPPVPPQTPPQPGSEQPPMPANAAPQAPTAQMQCANCHHLVDAAYSYCPHCGQSPNRRECRYCGRDVPAGAHRCIGCGAPVATRV